jgi:hypothetical protein
VPIVVRDIEADPAAAREKERLAPDVGVPVTVYGSQVVRGFSEPQLRKIATTYLERQKPAKAPAAVAGPSAPATAD